MKKEILKEIGLNDFEIEIFLTLTKHKKLTAYNISKKTGRYRQVCYDCLNRLLEKGFVSYTTQNNKKVFQAITPESILENLETQVQRYKDILPELKKYSVESEGDLSVDVFKGKNVVNIGLKDIISTLKLKNNKEVLCTAVDENIPAKERLLNILQYERDLKIYKIMEKVIIKRNSKGLFSKETSKYRAVPEKYFNPNPIQIYGDKVQIMIWGTPNHLIIIKNQEVADSFRKQFNLQWDNIKKLK